MDVLLENMIYGLVGIFLLGVVLIYVRKLIRETKIVDQKIEVAKQDGLFEPVSLHPVVDQNTCIQSGACIRACPEKDILGIRNSRATTINASRCIGHGACFHACPTQAITLCIGTEKRGVELPHVSQDFETNVSGVYIAGEMGGMGLIRNAVEQGRQAVDNLKKTIKKESSADFDLIVIGAGPAGISASLNAKKHGLKCLTLEQDSLGGTVYTFPRAKIVMTAPMELPLYGKVKLYETTKTELLELWNKVISDHSIQILENKKVESIHRKQDFFEIKTNDLSNYTAQKVLLAIGRRGTPRKLNVPGEVSEKVAYRLLEPELINGKNIMVVGGGDSAVESAMLLCENNKVTLSYRNDAFSRIKPANKERIDQAIFERKIEVILNSNLLSIDKTEVQLKVEGESDVRIIQNDLVYIFAGGELPMPFLKSIGIAITKKFGEAILKH